MLLSQYVFTFHSVVLLLPYVRILYLKNDFYFNYLYFIFVLYIRYGKRTTQGILNDLWNALARYYLNNFADGTKQVFTAFLYMHMNEP